MTKKLGRTPGRPRRFDPEEAIATAQQLFHSRGYDAVSIADLTDAFGIKPPSFYAAFGSKMGLYTRVLDRYACTGAIPLQTLLRADRPVAECLARVLEEAATLYAANPDAAGCLVLEGTHCDDPSAREAACGFHSAAETLIRRYIAERHPEDAERLTDFVGTVMAGLSAKSRAGYNSQRLQAIARLAGQALAKQ
ncbi:TetR/AcrR family transcriptional regulator [Superficieibacter sp. HKU1]|uniref:TetR/AcrR family transcriptional regulator n=1 Tax=Superficieibacter sp. HKU1 TaxID=3031919 RepID=UPI0023E27067|nr:TetR/AcrR family transcriptional regulator [Superficieibacter sp. HKU1]WES66512.1 TetR/AcrR family transcriptional regulator [Superficieibacter sp. HKU1]